jgi:hypothetical protein
MAVNCSSLAAIHSPFRLNSLRQERSIHTKVFGEPDCVFQIVRYLIDFITSLLEVFQDWATGSSGPGVDSNSSPTGILQIELAVVHYACQLPDGRLASNRSQQFGKCHSARSDCVLGRLGAIQTR